MLSKWECDNHDCLLPIILGAASASCPRLRPLSSTAPPLPPGRNASRRSLMAASSSTTGSPTARCTTTSGAARCAPAARSPSRAAASPPWPRSSTRSTSSVPSASSSSTRAPSRSRTTSLIVRTASSSSSARRPHPSICPGPWPSLPNCYCDPEALPRAEGPSPTETGTRVLGCAGWQEGLRGSHLLFFLCQSLWASPPPAAAPRLPALRPPRRWGWRTPPHEPAWPGQHPTLEPSLTHILAVEPGGGQAVSHGVSFYLYFHLTESSLFREYWGTPAPSRQCQHKSIHPTVEVPRGHRRFLVLLLSFQSPQAWVTAPAPHNCSDSTETGLSSNNVL